MAGIEQIRQLVKNQRVPKVLALGGSEQALLDESLALIKSQVLGGDDVLNYHRFAADEAASEEWLSCAKTMPFLGPQRLVEIHNAEKINAADASKIGDYIARPSDFCVLVFIFSKLDKRNKLVSLLHKQNILYEFSAPTNAEIENIIKSDIKKYNMKISAEALSLLIIFLDADLVALREAVKKLSLEYEGAELSVEHISAQISGNALPDVFKLARCISEGDLKTSLYILGLLRKNQENAIKFLGVLMWQFRMILHIRHCLDRNMAEWDIRKEVSVFGDRLTWMLKVAKKRPALFHSQRLTRLIQCDVALKSQKISEPLTLVEKALYQSVVGA